MRAIAGLVALVGGCGFSGHGGAATRDDAPAIGDSGGSGSGMIDGSDLDARNLDAPPPPGRRKPITIHAAKVGGALADFPVWIDLTTDPDLAARAAADGSDIYFTDANGTALAYERTAWQKSSGHLAAWVRTALAAGTDTTLYVGFGDPAITHPPQPPATFSNQFAIVWHLDDVGAGGALADTLGHATASNLDSTKVASGQLGSGVSFNGTSDQATFTNPLTGANAMSSHTISAWVNQRTTADDDTLIVLGNSGTDQARWLHTTFQSGHHLASGFYNDDLTTSTSLVGAGWSLVHWVYDATAKTTTLYVGGTQVGTRTASTSLATGNAGFLGNIPDNQNFGTNMGIHATVDEVRIATAARTTQWITTEVNNQTSPSTFYAVGGIELLP